MTRFNDDDEGYRRRLHNLPPVRPFTVVRAADQSRMADEREFIRKAATKAHRLENGGAECRACVGTGLAADWEINRSDECMACDGIGVKSPLMSL